jgi:SET domain-containing protein
LRDLTVRSSPGRGRGVFADRDFAEGELIERCPTLVFAGTSRPAVAQTSLDGYYFNWIPKTREVALCLGYGSLYNHSWTPNARWVHRIADNLTDIYARRPIAAGEEIYLNYTYAENSGPAWYQESKPRDGEPNDEQPAPAT